MSEQTPEPIIELEGVSRSFGGVAALCDISFTVRRGGTLGIIGTGGAGKSLILKLICGLDRPSSGRVVVDGVPVHSAKETALMPLRSRIGMIFQNYALFDDLNVGRNIGFPLERLGRFSDAEIQARVAERLAQVNLPGIEAKLPSALSGGMKKRICLARATVHNPPIMLCDDPTAGLDPVTTNRIFRLLKTLQKQNEATAIIVSHEVGYLTPICDRFLMLDQGRVIYDGPAAAAAECSDLRVRQFVTGEGIE